jgi:2'-5' RNA ligase
MRLFVAMDISEDIRSSLRGLATILRTACPSARWARIEGLHVTLKFIGETPAEKMEMIKSALAAIPSRAPISINFCGIGFFPNARRPRVLWAGIESNPQLTELAAVVDVALEPLGIPREGRAFAPHLTLARFNSPRGLDLLQAAIEKIGPLEFGSATMKEFHLYQSILKRGGAEYTRLATFSYAGTPAGQFARSSPE